ncbi:MAG: hypothetical protein QOI20_98 [Acidimicrobiaceae bacterium]|nr:hypothetical protein [Acidimicrobiaceae bacterium]
MPPGADAWTLGSLVIVRRRSADDERLLAHEAVHVGQWRSLGVGLFLWRYVGAYLRWRLAGYPHVGAYRRIPLEVEATWSARNPTVVGGQADNPGVVVTPPR